jgi:hypothetical protein
VRLLRPALILTALTASLGAPATAAPLPNACTLVADAQLASAIGGKIRHMARPVTNGARMCVWERTTFEVGPNPQVTLTVLPLTRDKFTAKWNRPIPNVRPVRGVADIAYSIDGGQWFVAWARGIEVVVNTTDLKTPLETAKRVAKLAFTRL